MAEIFCSKCKLFFFWHYLGHRCQLMYNQDDGIELLYLRKFLINRKHQSYELSFILEDFLSRLKQSGLTKLSKCFIWESWANCLVWKAFLMVWWNFILCSFGSRATEKYAELKCQDSGQLFIPIAVLNVTATCTFMHFYEDIVVLVPPVVSSPLKDKGLTKLLKSLKSRATASKTKVCFFIQEISYCKCVEFGEWILQERNQVRARKHSAW